LNITVNGSAELLEEEKSILVFLEAKAINPGTVVVEHNGNIVSREEWSTRILKENDVLEVLKFMGGGC
jgi:sulfur carrier protein